MGNVSTPENIPSRISQITSEHEVIGALLCCFCLQFFIVEQLVRNGWTTPYSWADNYISDLGAVACAYRPPDSDRFVCSPMHAAMNASFIVQGMLIAGGAAFHYNMFPVGRLRTVGLACLAIAGAGVIMVGFAPVDVQIVVHYAGAGLHFLGANLGMILLGVALLQQQVGNRVLPRPFGILALSAGSIGMVAFLLLLSGQYLGQGAGGMERIVAYPLPLVLSAFGITHLIKKKKAPQVTTMQRNPQKLRFCCVAPVREDKRINES